ncbi:F-box only protein 36 isoform X5 [Ursus maritimus]|uniref:F-box only protein 36 isoform X5 n=1 Tax=Ursus maritimus TaxID=29073 RepID=A0A384C198_URSMA|nr:F-box only protein 36 isoform X5 [Ursus maritimus]
MTPIKPRPFLVVLATAVASQDGVVAAGDSVRNCRTRPSAEQRLLPVIGHPVPGVCYHLNLAPLLVTKWLQQLQQSHQSTMVSAQKGALFLFVIFRWWKISLRSEYRSTKPGEAKESHEEFLDNSHLQVQIALIFGARILDYVFNLCEGKFDFLERLSDKLLLNIISYLDLEDIARLSQTSRRFAQASVHLPFLQEERKEAGTVAGASSCTHRGSSAVHV